MAIEVAARPDDAYKKAMSEQVDRWKATVARYDSDPKEQDGRKELMALARKYEAERDLAMSKYHNYEFASAAYQIGIVLASAAVITGMMLLAYTSIASGIIGLAFTGLGLFAPNMMHDLAHWLE